MLFSNPSVFEKSANCCICNIVMFYVSQMLSDEPGSSVKGGNVCLYRSYNIVLSGIMRKVIVFVT